MASSRSIITALLIANLISVSLLDEIRIRSTFPIHQTHENAGHSTRERRKAPYYPISDEIHRIVKGILLTSRNNIDMRPMESVDLGCNNKATSMILAQYRAKATVRWKHNGGNLKIEPSRMVCTLDSLAINDLLPRDSGVYHCEIKLSAHQLIVVAVYSLVVGEHLKMVSIGDDLRLEPHSVELGRLFPNSERSWITPQGSKVLTKLAASVDKDVLSDVTPLFTGNWTCTVFEAVTRRNWTTNRYGIIIAPPPTLTKRLRQLIARNKVNAILACVGGVMLILITVNCLINKFSKKKAKHMEEMDYLRIRLEADDSTLQADDVISPLLPANDAVVLDPLANVHEHDAEYGLFSEDMGGAEGRLDPFIVTEDVHMDGDEYELVPRRRSTEYIHWDGAGYGLVDGRRDEDVVGPPGLQVLADVGASVPDWTR